MFGINIENLRKLKHQILKKSLSLSIVCGNNGNEYKKIVKKKESIKTLKTLGLINNIEEYQKNI